MFILLAKNVHMTVQISGEKYTVGKQIKCLLIINLLQCPLQTLTTKDNKKNRELKYE